MAAATLGAHDPSMLRARLALSVLTLGLLASGPAGAQIYKYTKGDGTVVYTDSLAELPPERRAHYNRLEREAEQRRKAQENMLGKEEVERREAEAERKRLQQAQMAEAERQRRLASIEATLKRIRERRAEKAGRKAAWQKRMKEAKAKLQEKLEEFRKTQEEYKGLATKADFALFPGQGKKKEELRKKVARLEQEVDALIREVYVVIPEDARKAGVPPGWIR